MRDKNSGASVPGFYLWLISIIFSTAFTFYWDMIKDWSLGDK